MGRPTLRGISTRKDWRTIKRRVRPPYPVGPPTKMSHPCQQQKRDREESKHETQDDMQRLPGGRGKDPPSCQEDLEQDTERQ